MEDFRIISKEDADKVYSGARYGFTFKAFVAHPRVFMDWVRKRIEKLGGTFECRTIDSFDCLKCDFVINCTGLQ